MTSPAGGREADRQAIAAAATDYLQSWLDGDPQRMAGCLHPELAKRSIDIDPLSGEPRLETITAAEMVEATAAGRGTRYAPGFEISLLEQHDDIATVSVHSVPYVDYLHLARFGRRWLIVNVLWQRRPTDDARD